MDQEWACLVLAAPLTLFAAAILSRFEGGLRPRRLERMLTVTSWLGVAIAAGAAMAVAAGGTLTTPLIGGRGLGFSLRLDALSVSILLMVSLLSVVILRFGRTYLDGDARQGEFLGRLARTIGAVELLVVSGNLLLFFAAWVGTSLCLQGLLTFYGDRPGAVVAARKKFLVARLGDAALFGAFALVYTKFGTGEMSDLFAAAASGAGGKTMEAAMGLLALAALLKSAQFPTHGWLIEVMETPTPVSALLHAGILNAGPFLVVRHAALMPETTLAPGLLVVVGGFTALFASVALLTQPGIKVVLAYSSAAHMGFMLLLCGLGVHAAAILHLVAHSFYKAHAFLSSGSVIDEARAARVRVAPRLYSPFRLLGSLALAIGTYVGLALALGIQPAANPGLVAVGSILVMGLSQLLAPALDSRGTAVALLQTAALAGAVTLAFFGLEHAAHHLLQDALPAAHPPRPVVLVLSLLVLLAFAGAIIGQMTGATTRFPALRSAQVHWRNGFYANALFDRLVGALSR